MLKAMVDFKMLLHPIRAQLKRASFRGANRDEHESLRREKVFSSPYPAECPSGENVYENGAFPRFYANTTR